MEKPPRYEEHDEHEEESGLISHQPKPSFFNRHRETICMIWASISTLLLLLILSSQFILWKNNRNSGSYETGFDSDLEPARKNIELVQLPFSGEVHAHEDGTFLNDTTSPYTGPPSRSVDEAWFDLLDGLNIDVPRKEYPDYLDTYQWEEDGTFFSGLAVFHALHCLNRLRQALDMDYYHRVFSDPKDPSARMHIDHCIDHIRQSIQCHSDLTPMNWEKIGNKIVVKSDTKHTCRNFEKIHDWARQRITDFDSKTSVVEGRIFIVD